MRLRQLRAACAGILAGSLSAELSDADSRRRLGLGRRGHGIWYPVNLLAGMVLPQIGELPLAELQQFHADWLGYRAGDARCAVARLWRGVWLILCRGLPDDSRTDVVGRLLMPCCGPRLAIA